MSSLASQMQIRRVVVICEGKTDDEATQYTWDQAESLGEVLYATPVKEGYVFLIRIEQEKAIEDLQKDAQESKLC